MEDATSLVLRAKDGDVHAFAGLYAQIYKDLYRFAVCTLQNLHDAEDAVSETVLDAFSQIGSLRKPESFKSWVFAILSVKCRKKIQDYGKAGMELTEDLMRTEADLSEQLDVQEAFQRLSKEERMMLALKLFAGYSSNEIGALLQLPPGTIRSRQHRALKKMKAVLEDEKKQKTDAGKIWNRENEK